MRLPMTAAATAALLMIAGCSQSEAQVKAEFRDQVVNGCKSQSMGSKIGFDDSRFCGCLGDKSIEGRSADDLRRFGSDKAAGQKAGQEAAAHCVAAMAPAQPAAPAQAAMPAAEGPAAPAPTPAEEAPAEASTESE